MVMLQTTDRVLTQLAIISQKDYRDFEKFTNKDFVVNRCGSVLFATSEERARSLSQTLALQKELGVQSRELDNGELTKAVPVIKPDGIQRAIYCKEDGWVDQWALLDFYRSTARDLGATIHQDVEVARISTMQSGRFLVEVSDEEFESTNLVLAAGEFTQFLANQLSVGVPFTCNRRNIAILRPHKKPPDIPIAECVDDEWYIRPERERLVLVGVGETDQVEVPTAPGVIEEKADPRTHPRIMEYMKDRYPSLQDSLVMRISPGIRAMTADQRPIIAQANKPKGLFLCCGMSAFGITHSAASGRLMASLVDGRSLEREFEEIVHEVALDRSSLLPHKSG